MKLFVKNRMKFNISKRDLSIFIILLFSFNLINLLFLNFNNVNSYEINFETKKIPKISQSEASENISVEIKSYSQLIWFSGNIVIETSSNITGFLKIDLSDGLGGSYFQNFQQIIPISNTSENEVFEIPIIPQVYIFPGMYNLSLIINYIPVIDSIDEDTILSSHLQINVGLGPPILIILIIIFGISFTLILTKRETIKEEILTYEPEKQIEAALDAPQGKIKCPECKKIINEGLTFCPECGNRIPEFFRYHLETPGPS